jgi:fatty acid desaturase
MYLMRKGRVVPGASDEIAWAGLGEYIGAGFTWLLLVCVYTSVAIRSGVFIAASPALVCSVVYYLFSQVSHMNWASLHKDPIGTEWAVAQIGTAAGDYAYDSRFWNLVSIGLNNQTIHHLFPGIHAYHYPALARLFRPVFEKHGLSVHRWTQTYTQSLLAHVAFVYDRTTV